MRKGREFYSRNYEEVIKLHQKGMSVRNIAEKMNMSYSCIYHWVKGIRKPETGNLNEFEKLLKEKGPMPVAEIKEKFPKHNELFLTARRRGMPIKRYVLNRKFGDFSTFYFLNGQEKELKKAVKELFDKYRGLREKMTKMLESY